MRALFGRKIANIKELKELTEKALRAGKSGIAYDIIKQIELEDEAFRSFASDFFKEQIWITKEDGGINDKGEIRCIRVINKVTGEVVLVNNEGYCYSRYTALELE